MSSTDLAASANDSGAATPRNDADLRAARGTSPNQRAWARFKRNRLGHASLWLFIVLLVVTTLAELVSNDLPYVARIDGQ
jgi:microcin C transport system permease protein